jgi:hypothetical protein
MGGSEAASLQCGWAEWKRGLLPEPLCRLSGRHASKPLVLIQGKKGSNSDRRELEKGAAKQIEPETDR